jgi:hypothetical protein
LYRIFCCWNKFEILHFECVWYFLHFECVWYYLHFEYDTIPTLSVYDTISTLSVYDTIFTLSVWYYLHFECVWNYLHFESVHVSCDIVALRENFVDRPESYDSFSAKSCVFLAHCLGVYFSIPLHNLAH